MTKRPLWQRLNMVTCNRGGQPHWHYAGNAKYCSAGNRARVFGEWPGQR